MSLTSVWPFERYGLQRRVAARQVDRTGDGSGRQPEDDDREQHPLNPNVRKGKSGIWAEDELPVTEWEAPEQRVVLPESLHESLDPISPVLRWDRDKFDRVTTVHERDAHIIPYLSSYLDHWSLHGTEIGSGNQRIIFEGDDARWYSVSIGTLLGSDNMITIVGSRRSSFVRNRLNTLDNVKERKSDP